MFWSLLSCLEAGQMKTENSRQSHSDGATPCHIYRPSPGLGRVEGPRTQPDSCLQDPICRLGDKTGVPTFPRTLIGFKLWINLTRVLKARTTLTSTGQWWAPIKIRKLEGAGSLGQIPQAPLTVWPLFPSQRLPSLAWAKGNRAVYLGSFFSVGEFPSKEPFYFLVEIKVLFLQFFVRGRGVG